MYDRRRFVQSALALGALAFVGGCRGRLVRPPDCPQYQRPDGRIVIDAHCHIFNGSDLQVAGFVNQVGLGQPDLSPLNLIGDIVQTLAWSLAPTADEELRWLRRRRGGDPQGTRPDTKALGSVPHPLSATLLDMGPDSDERYVEFWRRLHAFDDGAAKRSGLLRADDAPARVDAFFRSLESDKSRAGVRNSAVPLRLQLQSRAGVEQALREEEAGDGRVSAIVSFLKTFFRFRTENAWTMMQTYGCDSGAGLDLLCPAMVDFDLWLGDADRNRGRTRSPIEDQLKVMSEIALATQGRVQAMAPFNPLRAACDPDAGYLRRAIETYGCIAFKVYPPMGFRATDNAQVAQPALKQCPGNRPVATRPQLDRILHDFFSHCAEQGIPVMAHASDSNAAYAGAGALAAPKFWEDLLGSYGREFAADRTKLRINLGHMGGDHSTSAPNAWRERVAEAMLRFPGQVYADLSYYEHMMGDADVRRALARQMQMIKRDGVWQHTMYGSDWSMLAAQPRWRRYIDDFAGFIERDLGLDAPQRAALMGDTARTFYGLRDGEPNMERLRRFHATDDRGMDALTEALR
ncbi:MAG: amidohydrolase family protein [Pseudomonadota bacterium]